MIGVSLLGVSLATAVERRIYQVQQERVVEEMMAASEPASSATAPATPAVTSPAVDVIAPAAAPAPAEPEDVSTELPAGNVATTAEKISGEKATAEVVPTSAGEHSLSSLLGMIEVPRLQLSAVVAAGEDAETLDRAVGWLTDTARPGSGGNAAFAAHRDTLFRPLEDIRIGDIVRVTIPPHTYEYRVKSLDVVAPTDVSVLNDRGRDELTLITCYPFRYIGPAPNRFIVKAERLESGTAVSGADQVARR